ncbi:DUF7146 domain-containing protein [Microvirga solisilvae]|uniref:DUF7146 domain-containing protein n=1 Tax=Microvirga solisilvae TaxID=2919498 RepID=UPI001FAEAB36|nr:CHC2 zinc finger domain-containing protein [Microvirga solisilvae]
MIARSVNSAFEDWKSRAKAADILAVFERLPNRTKLKRAGRERVGPCPVCSAGKAKSDRFAIKPSERVFHCRGWGGGDVIRMVEHVAQCDFLAACEIITGEAPPKGQGRRLTAQEIAQRDAEARAAQAAQEAAEATRIAAERERLYRIWRHHSVHWLSTPVEAYLHLRGVRAPDHAPLRFKPDMRFYVQGEDERPLCIHTGPAMLAAIQGGDGRFAGLHITWIDLSQAKGQAVIVHPETGGVLRSKKTRGVKQGGYIDLVRVPHPLQMITGEGNETLLSAYADLIEAGRDLSRTLFRCAVDLGNLGGGSAESVPHPSETVMDARGNVSPLMVAGPVPDLESPSMPVPDSVTDIVTLIDGDSEPFATRQAHLRFARRWARDDRSIRGAHPGEGKDFNDIRRERVA